MLHDWQESAWDYCADLKFALAELRAEARLGVYGVT